jgi:3-oxoacyl-[acyl-carrier protein] reductase
VDLGLTNKIVLITGASGGIGRALAEAFAEEGARVGLVGHRHHEELETWRDAQSWRDRSVVISADVRHPLEMVAAVDSLITTWGRVDVCVANAGIWTPPSLGLHEVPEERIRETLEVNLLGSLWTARAFLGGLARTGPSDDAQGASLVFTGSTAGRFGEAGHADYSASKAGLTGLVRSLKNEIVHIDPFGRVNMVEPGWTVTHMARPALEEPGVIAKVTSTMPVRQLARAADIARAILWISSPLAARHVSGEILTVSGGMEGRLQWSAADIDEAAVRKRAQSE